MAYTTTTQVRRITNIVVADISDADLTNLIIDATAQLNSDINTKVVRERVLHIDDTRKNDINGTNTTYYVRNWKGKYLGDMNNDGSIDEDDITVFLVASDGTETEATVSSVTSDEGKFVLSTAPTTATASKMFVTYEWCFDDPDTPSARISLACAFLVAAYGYAKTNWGMAPEQAWGNARFRRDMMSSNRWFQKYENEISKINSEMGDYSESEIF